MMYDVQHRISRVIRQSIVKNKSNSEFYVKLQEYDNFKQLFNCFIKKNFSKISILYGGFTKLHELLLKHNMVYLLDDHSNKECSYCSKIIKRNSSEIQSNLSMDKHKNSVNSQTNKENTDVMKKKETSFLSKLNPMNIFKKKSEFELETELKLGIELESEFDNNKKPIISNLKPKLTKTHSNSKKSEIKSRDDFNFENSKNDKSQNNNTSQNLRNTIGNERKDFQSNSSFFDDIKLTNLDKEKLGDKDLIKYNLKDNDNFKQINESKNEFNKENSRIKDELSDNILFLYNRRKKFSIELAELIKPNTIINYYVLKEITNGFECIQSLLIKSDKYENSSVLLFINKDTLIIIDNPDKYDSNCFMKKEEYLISKDVTFTLIDIILLKEILQITSKKSNKSIITLTYNSFYRKENLSSIFDFNTEKEAKSFVSKTKDFLMI